MFPGWTSRHERRHQKATKISTNQSINVVSVRFIRTRRLSWACVQSYHTLNSRGETQQNTAKNKKQQQQCVLLLCSLLIVPLRIYESAKRKTHKLNLARASLIKSTSTSSKRGVLPRRHIYYALTLYFIVLKYENRALPCWGVQYRPGMPGVAVWHDMIPGITYTVVAMAAQG